MYAGIVFFLTLAQLGLVFGSHALEAKDIFNVVVIYGSPLYLAMHLVQSVASLLGAGTFYLVALVYHLFKYTLFFGAQLRGEQNALFIFAILFEAIYLAISGYYLN